MKTNKIFLSFKISSTNDIYAFFRLLKHSDRVRHKLLSFLSMSLDEVNEETVRQFVNTNFQTQRDEIKKSSDDISKSWSNKADFFLIASEKVFGKNLSILNNVTASPSIWPVFGRFFEKK